MGIIELRMDGTGFTFIAEAVMVFLVAAIQHVDGGKLSFKTKFRHRFTAEIIFFHVELVNTHGHNAVGTAGFSDGFQAFFGKKVVLLGKGRVFLRYRNQQGRIPDTGRVPKLPYCRQWV